MRRLSTPATKAAPPGSSIILAGSAGAGDFNGDRRSDILWRNLTTGERRIWFMAGTDVAGIVSPGAVPTDWETRN